MSEGAKVLSNLKTKFNKKPKKQYQTYETLKYLKLDSGSTGWQSTPKNLQKINLLNLFGSLKETLWKKQKVL